MSTTTGLRIWSAATSSMFAIIRPGWTARGSLPLKEENLDLARNSTANIATRRVAQGDFMPHFLGFQTETRLFADAMTMVE